MSLTDLCQYHLPIHGTIHNTKHCSSIAFAFYRKTFNLLQPLHLPLAVSPSKIKMFLNINFKNWTVDFITGFYRFQYISLLNPEFSSFQLNKHFKSSSEKMVPPLLSSTDIIKWNKLAWIKHCGSKDIKIYENDE